MMLQFDESCSWALHRGGRPDFLCRRIQSMFPAVTMFTVDFKERIGVQKLEYLLLCAQESQSWEMHSVGCLGFVFGSFHSFFLAFI